jgi:hypothetical protein
LRLDAVTGGKMVLAKSLAEMPAERGKSFAAVSSGSTGSALLGNRAPKGVGILVSGHWEPPTRVAFPDAVGNHILRCLPRRAKAARDSMSRRSTGLNMLRTMCCRTCPTWSSTG